MKLTILQGNTLELLPTLPADSIDLVITSPPYWGLRAYGTSQQIFGGKAECQHNWEVIETARPNQAGGKNGEHSLTDNQNAVDYSNRVALSNKCNICGAWRGEYGSEPTMEAYLDNTMRWVKEVWRVLKPTGSFVLNIGDCFIGGGRGVDYPSDTSCMQKVNASNQRAMKWADLRKQANIYKTKQLLSVSSFAYCRIVSETDFVCRGEHIWAKPNVPSPIRSRLKHSHEKLFWFVKDADKYYFNNKAWMRKITHPTRLNRKNETNAGAINQGVSETSIFRKTDWISPNEETIEHSWRIVPVGAKQNGFELEGKQASEHIAPFPENLIRPYIQSLCPNDGITLDPFLGSGTTMRVAMEEGRDATGCELNEKSIIYAKKRLNWGQGLGVEYV